MCKRAKGFIIILGQGMETRKNMSVLQQLVTTLLLALNQSLTETLVVSNETRVCLQAFQLTSSTGCDNCKWLPGWIFNQKIKG